MNEGVADSPERTDPGWFTAETQARIQRVIDQCRRDGQEGMTLAVAFIEAWLLRDDALTNALIAAEVRHQSELIAINQQQEAQRRLLHQVHTALGTVLGVGDAAPAA